MKKSKAYSLVELLIVIGLISVTIGITGDIIITLVRSYTKTQTTTELERASSFVVAKIEKEFKNAITVGDVSDYEMNFTTKGIDTGPICVKYTLETVDIAGVSVGVLNRCQGGGSLSSNECACTSPLPITDSADIKVSSPSAFALVYTSPASLKLDLVFTKKVDNATENSLNPFLGEVKVNTTIVAKSTYD